MRAELPHKHKHAAPIYGAQHQGSLQTSASLCKGFHEPGSMEAQQAIVQRGTFQFLMAAGKAERLGADADALHGAVTTSTSLERPRRPAYFKAEIALVCKGRLQALQLSVKLSGLSVSGLCALMST